MKLVIIMIVITISIRELSVAITIIAKQRSMIEQPIDIHRRSGGHRRRKDKIWPLCSPISLSLFLSLCFFFSLFIYLFIHLFIYLFLSFSLSLSLSFFFLHVSREQGKFE